MPYPLGDESRQAIEGSRISASSGTPIRCHMRCASRRSRTCAPGSRASAPPLTRQRAAGRACTSLHIRAAAASRREFSTALASSRSSFLVRGRSHEPLREPIGRFAGAAIGSVEAPPIVVGRGKRPRGRLPRFSCASRARPRFMAMSARNGMKLTYVPRAASSACRNHFSASAAWPSSSRATPIPSNASMRNFVIGSGLDVNARAPAETTLHCRPTRARAAGRSRSRSTPKTALRVPRCLSPAAGSRRASALASAIRPLNASATP